MLTQVAVARRLVQTRRLALIHRGGEDLGWGDLFTVGDCRDQLLQIVRLAGAGKVVEVIDVVFC
jgi:hypothetical protein